MGRPDGYFMPGAVLDFIAIASTSTNIPTALGTLLCGLTPPIAVPGPPDVPFALPIAEDCTHVGLILCTQGASVDAVLNIGLTNALDVTLGTY